MKKYVLSGVKSEKSNVKDITYNFFVKEGIKNVIALSKEKDIELSEEDLIVKTLTVVESKTPYYYDLSFGDEEALQIKANISPEDMDNVISFAKEMDYNKETLENIITLVHGDILPEEDYPIAL